MTKSPGLIKNQILKKSIFTYVIMGLIGLSGFGLATFLGNTNNETLSESEASSIPKGVLQSLTSPKCKASTASEVKDCVDKLNNGSITSVEITAKIYCTESNLCNYNLTTTKGGEIFGTPGSGSGFFRSGDYKKGAFGAPVFNITSASNIKLSNIFFVDDINSPGQPYCVKSEGHDCGINDITQNPSIKEFNNNPLTFPFIKIENSNGITIRQITMKNSKRDGILTINSNNITLSNTSIETSYLRGLLIKGGENFLIEGSYFYNNNGAGLRTDAIKNITVKNNLFVQNQVNTPWGIGGGQINLYSQKGTIEGNRFVYTSLPVSFENYGGGIELHTQNEDITIRDNSFVNKVGNSVVGPAIYNDPSADPNNTTTSTYKNIVISNNLIDTGIDKTTKSAIYDWNNFNTWILNHNCFNGDMNCVINALGTLSISPDFCTIENGKSGCSQVLSWYTNFGNKIEVKVNGNSLYTTEFGTKTLNNISTTPTSVEVLNNETLLVSGVAIGKQIENIPKTWDLNNDEKVNILDYNIFMSNYGSKYNISDFNEMTKDLNK